MNDLDDLRTTLKQEAISMLGGLAPSDREALLIKCWMSHDARWFTVVAKECGVQTANRLNQLAAHEIGRVEAQRIVRTLRLAPVESVDDYLVAQEVFIGLLGPDLLDYRVVKTNDAAFQMNVQRCFAHENTARAGLEDYECGIFARVAGWLDALGLSYEMSPCLGKCLKAQGRECVYTFTLGKSGPST
ncbi:MAG TPA: DUF6125 family protein [Blastocatellia bacterium]|nr:DUF6125 family protein [Blastocatellia bacterium]